MARGIWGKVCEVRGRWAEALEAAGKQGSVWERVPEVWESGRTCSGVWEGRAEALEARESSRNPETYRSVKSAKKG